MLRCCSRLRSFSLHSHKPLASSSSRRLLHYSPHPLQFSCCNPLTSPLFNASSSCPSTLALHAFRSSPLPSSLVQFRHVSSRERKKRRKPMTPVTSKIKKFKMKFYSSYKSRFRLLNDGTIRRWKEGKQHRERLASTSANIHCPPLLRSCAVLAQIVKSKKSKRRLRKPAIVPPAYAKVMKKLNFCA